MNKLLTMALALAAVMLTSGCAAPQGAHEPQSSDPTPSPESTQTTEQAPSAEPEASGELPRLRLLVGGKEIASAALNDSAIAKDFLALLPLTLEISDYNRTEKIASLPRELDVSAEPDGYDPAAGDIAFYAPWGNLSIFYEDFGYSDRLMLIGRVGSGIEAIAALEDGTVLTIEEADDV